MNIIELAKEAGFPTLTDYGHECLERFRNLIIEECAKVVDANVKQCAPSGYLQEVLRSNAAAIREMKK